MRTVGKTGRRRRENKKKAEAIRSLAEEDSNEAGAVDNWHGRWMGTSRNPPTSPNPTPLPIIYNSRPPRPSRPSKFAIPRPSHPPHIRSPPFRVPPLICARTVCT